MSRTRFPPRRYLLRGDTVSARLDAAHLTHADMAEALGLARSTWSQLVHAHRAVTPRVRRALLAHPAFAGLAEDALWTVAPTDGAP